MQMTKEEKFGQEVAHLLGRANLMKCTKTVDEYKVTLSPLMSCLDEAIAN
jgi:hypothetical protein